MSRKKYNNLLPETWTQGAAEYGFAVREELSDTVFPNAWRNIILSRAPSKKVLRILDVGTGPGFFPIILAQAGHDVCGLDFSSGMLEIARSNADDAGVSPRFILGDSFSALLEPNSFDLILSRMLTWVLPDPIAVYKRWFDLLAPSGRLMIFDSNKFDTDTKHEEAFLPTKTTEDPESYLDPDGELLLCHVLRPDWDEKALAEIGFDAISSERNICAGIWDEKNPLYGKYRLFLVSAEKPVSLQA